MFQFMRARRRGPERPQRRLVVAWSQNPGRPQALAEVVGASALTLYPRPLGSSNPLLRYAVSAILTLVEIVRRRPAVVIVQNPVVFPALIAWAWTAATSGKLILDSHPSAFGAKDNRQGRLMLPVSRWLSRRAVATLVTVPAYVELLESWGARGIVVHEPPVEAVAPDRRATRLGATVAFCPTLFAEDEPIRELVDVARLLPHVTFAFTGRPERCPVPEADRPDNWVLLGFVSLDRFLEHMASSDVVLSLTDDVTSVARSAYEATYLELPLVVSDVPSMVEHFPHAVSCGDTPSDIARAISEATRRPPDGDVLRAARLAQLDRWETQRAQLVGACRPVDVTG